MAPSPYIFIISIGPVDMNKYARFDEIPSMTLKDIKETKRYGRTDGRTDNFHSSLCVRVKVLKPEKQEAQRATIPHLTASHQNILNSSQVKDFLNWSRAANSTVHGWIQWNFKLIRDYINVLVTCKNEENPIKIEGARVLTSLLFDFSNAQWQLTPKSVLEFRQNLNSSMLL